MARSVTAKISLTATQRRTKIATGENHNYLKVSDLRQSPEPSIPLSATLAQNIKAMDIKDEELPGCLERLESEMVQAGGTTPGLFVIRRGFGVPQIVDEMVIYSYCLTAVECSCNVCYLNGQSWFDGHTTNSIGRVGFGTSKTAARFRNIRVTSIPGGAELWQGLPELPRE